MTFGSALAPGLILASSLSWVSFSFSMRFFFFARKSITDLSLSLVAV